MNGRAIRRRTLIPAVVVLNVLPVLLVAQGAPATFREVHMGMEVRLEIVAPPDSTEAIARRAFDRIAALDAILSNWRADSELRRLSDATPGTAVPVSRPLAQVLALALRIARDSRGAFDPTIGPLTRLWRESARTGAPITDADRAAARARVNYRWVLVDTNTSRVTLLRAGILLDLGAIAKGWILDEVIAQLARDGAIAALAEAGGDVAVFGSPAPGRAWGIAVPRASGDTVLQRTAGAVSTSGPSAQSLPSARGRGESHVIRTTTGRGMQNGVRVTVSGPRAAITDALATAVSLLPPARGAALALRHGVTIIVYERDSLPPDRSDRD